MLETVILFLLKWLRFTCATCGEITVERDRRGNLRCVACFELEAQLLKDAHARAALIAKERNNRPAGEILAAFGETNRPVPDTDGPFGERTHP